MDLYIMICFFTIGTVFGSFYHVVATRLSDALLSFNRPKRSICPFCKNSLKWYELIPLLSFLIQGGKCRHCKEKISYIYFFIELITGMLFALCYYSFGLNKEIIIPLTLVSLFSVVIVSDINYFIIPDEVTFITAIILIAANFYIYPLNTALLKILSGGFMFFFMYLLMVLGYLLFKKESLGGADVKLMFIVGLAVNPLLGLAVIFIASVVALPISIIIYIANKERMIPFGPFIMLALLIIYFTKIDVGFLIEFLRFV